MSQSSFMGFPIKPFSSPWKVSPPCVYPWWSLGTQQPPWDFYSGNIIISPTIVIVNINIIMTVIAVIILTQGLNSVNGANNWWQNGKLFYAQQILRKNSWEPLLYNILRMSNFAENSWKCYWYSTKHLESKLHDFDLELALLCSNSWTSLETLKDIYI